MKILNAVFSLWILLALSPLLAKDRLMGKQVLITGGSRGIGESLVRGMVAEGAEVVFTYHKSKDQAEALQKELTAQGGRVHVLSFAAEEEGAADKLVQEALHIFPTLNTVVLNAGYLETHNFLNTDLEAVHKHMQINALAPMQIMQGLSHHMIAEHIPGSFILITSMRGVRPVSRLFPYSLSKVALGAVGRMAAQDLAPYGIRVNSIAPGATLTDMMKQIHPNPEKLAERYKRVPLGRIGHGEDHVGAAIYLASDEAQWTTGAELIIDGGELNP